METRQPLTPYTEVHKYLIEKNIFFQHWHPPDRRHSFPCIRTTVWQINKEKGREEAVRAKSDRSTMICLVRALPESACGFYIILTCTYAPRQSSPCANAIGDAQRFNPPWILPRRARIICQNFHIFSTATGIFIDHSLRPSHARDFINENTGCSCKKIEFRESYGLD